MWLACMPALVLGAAAGQAASAAEPVHVGSKRFTESYVLGEIVRQTLLAKGIAAEHKQGLGNTGILESALASGAIDLYPEYTGTIVRELLKRDGNPSLAELNTWLAPRGLKAAVPLGFNNTYALAMLETRAEALGITRISDLLRPEAAALHLGLSHEFLERADGWPALKAAYRLPLVPGAGIDHGLAYEAVAAGRVDIIDVYSTDAKVGRYRLRVLKDDLGFFPKYEAVLLMRAAIDPTPLRGLEGRIDAATMIGLNAQVELDGMSFAEVARGFVAGTSARPGAGQRQGFVERLFAPDFGRLLGQHLLLVFGSLALAIGAGVPLGIAA
ncbi:MAG: amino acid ABC transporter permease, partial [Pseudomonadota bacterium]|nr:amino acid ABC transporter permease [Pseudomonadota bacterium]